MSNVVFVTLIVYICYEFISYLSNHFELNKINRRAHTAVAGLAATDRFSVCLTTVVVRSSVHYQGITLKQPPVKAGRCGTAADWRAESGVSYDRICCPPDTSHSLTWNVLQIRACLVSASPNSPCKNTRIIRMGNWRQFYFGARSSLVSWSRASKFDKDLQYTITTRSKTWYVFYWPQYQHISSQTTRLDTFWDCSLPSSRRSICRFN